MARDGLTAVVICTAVGSTLDRVLLSRAVCNQKQQQVLEADWQNNCRWLGFRMICGIIFGSLCSNAAIVLGYSTAHHLWLAPSHVPLQVPSQPDLEIGWDFVVVYATILGAIAVGIRLDRFRWLLGIIMSVRIAVVLSCVSQHTHRDMLLIHLQSGPIICGLVLLRLSPGSVLSIGLCLTTCLYWSSAAYQKFHDEAWWAALLLLHMAFKEAMTCYQRERNLVYRAAQRHYLQHLLHDHLKENCQQGFQLTQKSVARGLARGWREMTFLVGPTLFLLSILGLSAFFCIPIGEAQTKKVLRLFIVVLVLGIAVRCHLRGGDIVSTISEWLIMIKPPKAREAYWCYSGRTEAQYTFLLHLVAQILLCPIFIVIHDAEQTRLSGSTLLAWFLSEHPLKIGIYTPRYQASYLAVAIISCAATKLSLWHYRCVVTLLCGSLACYSCYRFSILDCVALVGAPLSAMGVPLCLRLQHEYLPTFIVYKGLLMLSAYSGSLGPAELLCNGIFQFIWCAGCVLQSSQFPHEDHFLDAWDVMVGMAVIVISRVTTSMACAAMRRISICEGYSRRFASLSALFPRTCRRTT